MAVIEAIETVYLEADAANVTFSSVSGYAHLQLNISGKSAATGSGNRDVYVQLNGDTGGNYYWNDMTGYTSSTSGDAYTGFTHWYMGAINGNQYTRTANYGSVNMIIPNYTSANIKTAVMSFSGEWAVSPSNPMVKMSGGGWSNKAAVTSIKLYPSSGSFQRGTAITIYGIKSS